MRALVQRVSWARVRVDRDVVGEIGRGFLVYLGVGRGDGASERDYVLGKVLGLRVFDDDEGKMARGLHDVGGGLLVVSQFTLYGDLRRGRRPSFEGAMAPAGARQAYDAFVDAARAAQPPVAKVETGVFGASMEVESLNDGPVTLWIDTAERG